MSERHPVAVPRRPRGLSLGLNRTEWALDVAALIAIIVELTRQLSSSSYAMFPVLILATAAAVCRRRMPIMAAIAALLASGLALLTPASTVQVWVVAEVCLFSLALRRERSTTLWLGGAHATLLYVGAIVAFEAAVLDPVALILPVWTAAIIAAGLFFRTNNDYVRALEEHSQSSAAYRDSEVRHRINEERLRIARDLHDSVAHTVSAIAVHAGAAERHLTRDPARAHTALQQVRASARAVVDELQDILSVLRSQDDACGEEEQSAVAGLDGIPALVEATHATGMHVTLRVDTPESVDPALGVAVYRIVQESLTNARKHGASPISVSITHDKRALHIEVINLVERPTRGAGTGFGLIGMRERASSVHGTIHTQAEHHRFILRADLPLHTHDLAEET